MVDVFLQINDYELIATEVDAVVTFQALAAGEFDENQLAEWIGRNMRAYGEGRASDKDIDGRLCGDERQGRGLALMIATGWQGFEGGSAEKIHGYH